ncbi:MAG: hypothetical protein HC764_23795 [Pleurocapsa sp. CRU_1_2]|nr:hypothetical protein [Pleurocapsa sp. CRU_1_2]
MNIDELIELIMNTHSEVVILTSIKKYFANFSDGQEIEKYLNIAVKKAKENPIFYRSPSYYPRLQKIRVIK